MRAIVIFSDGGEPAHPLGFLLRRGFEHCCVAVQTGDYWVLLDGERGVPVVNVIAPASFDLAKYYRDADLTVVETEQRGQPLRSPFLLNNCVGLVKAVLCIRSRAITPYALYRHLLKEARS